MALLLIAALFLVACGEGPTTPPGNGSIVVNIITTGGDLDEDGYELIAASRTTMVAPQSIVSLGGVAPGMHMVELRGLADNCSVVGDNPRSTIVESGRGAREEFEVRCDPTGIRVVTTTTGPDQPALGYAAAVGTRSSYVGPNGSAVISRLPASSQTVSLSHVADNCSVADGNERTVVVENRKLASVAFAINCATTDARVALVLDSAENGRLFSWIAVADARGTGVPTALVKGNSPAWSPDRKTLVYTNTVCDFYYGSYCSGGLVFRDAATGIESTRPAGQYGMEPAWSPDGRYIAFSRHSGADAKLHVMDLNGTTVLLPTPGVARAYAPSWSPDGQRLVFECVFEPRYEVCLVNRDGTGFLRLTNNSDFDGNPEWSPDGSRIAIATSTPLGLQGTPAVALINPDGTGITPLTEGIHPSWSPDGSKLVFARVNGLFTVNADGSGVTRITAGRHTAPIWRR